MLTVLRGLALGTLIALVMAAAAPPARAQDRDYDERVFYDELAAYGQWSEHPRWGNVWRPNVSDDWRPYSRGYWAYTEEHGWYWVTDEPFGWAVFHYGRWVLDEDDGWVWIPGSEWGPAWVAWRHSEEYVGWAPLPPDARWGADGQLFYDERYYYEPRYASAAWCFVHPGYLTTPGLYRFLAPGPQSYAILRRTQPIYGYRRFDRGVFNAGYDVRRFERHLGRPVPLMRLRAVGSPREHALGRGHGGPDIPVFRPRIIERQGGPGGRPPAVGGPDRRSYGHPGYMTPPSAGMPPTDARPRSRAPDWPAANPPPSARFPTPQPQPQPRALAPPSSPGGLPVSPPPSARFPQPQPQPRALTPPPSPGGPPVSPPAARAPGLPPGVGAPQQARPAPKKDDKKPVEPR